MYVWGIRRVGIVIGLVTLTGSVLVMSSIAMAQSPSRQWEDVTGALMNAQDQPQVTRESWHTPGCEPQGAIVEDYSDRVHREICVVSSDNLQLAVYKRDAGGTALYALKRTPDEVFHRIANLTVSPSKLVLLPDDTILGASEAQGDALAMYSLANVHERTIEVAVPSGPSTYHKVYDVNMQDSVKFVDAKNKTFSVRSIAVSKNKKFAAAQSLGRGIVRVNLETREVKRISDDTAGQLDTALAISDNGQRVVVTGTKDAPHRMYTGLDTCGSDEVNTTFQGRQRCYAASFATNIEPELANASVYEVAFSSNGDFAAYTWNDNTRQARKLQFAPDPDSYRLEYLALGDSYSSGEGDIERSSSGASYYLAGTSDRGGCHISSRSYPFRLKTKWDITGDYMQSVACSGAKLLPDMDIDIYETAGYFGQHGQLRGKDTLEERRAGALKYFWPAIVEQIQFVKKYQPKLVTFTAGGNDVGFAEILTYCASTQHFFAFTCDQAKEGTMPHRVLYDAINARYYYTTQFIENLKNASPQSKIAVIGYPSFIAVGAACGLNDGSLNTRERAAINDAVIALNEVLKKAAQDMSVSYVDVEDVLHGGRMCEGGEYVTSVTDAGLLRTARGESSESFHPNASGHAKIASRIDKSGIYAKESVSTGSSFIFDPHAALAFLYKIVSGDKVLYVTDTVRSVFESSTFKPGTTVGYFGYSDEVHLGEFAVKSDGSVEADLDIGKLPPGRHLLVASGQSYTDKPVRYYQFIEVHASKDDADGDGIKNSDDRCNFIAAWYDERTGEDICAAPINLNAASKSSTVSQSPSRMQPLLAQSQKPSDSGATILNAKLDSPRYGVIGGDLRYGSKEQTASSRSDYIFWGMLLLAVGVIIYGIIYKKRSAATTRTQDK